MHDVPTLIAFGITDLPMLGWLAAAAIPIIIHLWSRRKYRETSWAAMEILLAALKRQSRRMRFQQWILLAIRVSIVVLIVLALSEPYTGQNGIDKPTSKDVAHKSPATGDSRKSENAKQAAVATEQTIRVLCIDGRPEGRPFQGAADFLALALAPSGKTSSIQVDVAAESALLERKLDPYGCVFLCNVAQFTEREAKILDAYLGRGGSLVVFLGDQVMPDRYNAVLGVKTGQGRAGGGNILPAGIGPLDVAPQYRLDPLDYRHPILQPFRGRGESSLVTTPVLKHYKLMIPANSQASTILALANGDPLMVEGPIHGGRVIMVATSADASWTAMPLWPSFVPLVQELARWAARKPMQARGTVSNRDANKSDSETNMPEKIPNRLPVIILYAVLALLFIETFIAWKMHGNRNPTQR
jgi:hypothetical protein